MHFPLSRPGLLLLLALPLAFVACRPVDPEAEAAAERAAVERLIALNISYPKSDYTSRGPGVPGGVLRATTALDTNTFNVHSISNGNVQWLGRFLYDCLIYLDNEGNPTPWLAKSWDISPDGLVYTFHLREDVTFSDGTRFDAEAVKVNLEHMRAPATKSPLAGNYIAPISELRVLSPFTIEARLSAPYHPLLNVLSQSWLGMISPRQIREAPAAIKESPSGTGPFVLTSYKAAERAVFKRRDDYAWAPDFINHTGPAYLDGIVLDFVSEALVRYASLEARQHDFTFDAPPQNAASLRANPDYIFSSRVRQGNPTRSVSFNTSRPPFDDIRVRRAAALAIDRDGITRLVGFGEFIPKSDFLAVNTRYYDPSFKDVLAYDPAEANRLLDEAGWTGRAPDGIRTKNGERLSAELLSSESAGGSPIPVAVQSDLQKIGFELRIVQFPQPRLLELRRENRYQVTGGGYWHTNTPDGLYILYHGSLIPTDTTFGQNSARIADPVLDDILLRARRAVTDDERRSLYREAQHLLTELVPAVPLHESHTVISHHRSLRGVIFDTSHNTPLLTGAWFENGKP